MGWDITGLGSVADLFGNVIDKIWPDKTEAEKAKAALAQAQLQGQLQSVQNDFNLALEQIKVNAVEAASADPYTSRWRPTVGYICCAALAWNFIVHPLFLWVVALTHATVSPPPVIENGLMELIFGMLGIGFMRTWEKSKGVAK